MAPRTSVLQSCRFLVATSLAVVVSTGARVGVPHDPHPVPRRAAPALTAEDILAKSRAAYAALKSYADTGTIVVEYGHAADPSKDVHTFSTYFRSPRHFYFDYHKTSETGRLVVWSDDQAFHSWWQDTGNEDEYPKGRGASVFTSSSYPTTGSINLISPWLFPGAGLIGTLTDFGDASLAGTESIGGRKCHKIVGVAKSVYQSGYVTAVRRTTVWIDVETMLVRQVFENFATSGTALHVNRMTTTLIPHANPPLEDKHFQFTVPSLQK